MATTEPAWLPEAQRLARHKVQILIKVHGFNEDDYDDLCQEFMLKMMTAAPNYNPELMKLSSFIEQVFRNLSVNLIKKHQYRLQFEAPNSIVESDEDEEELQLTDLAIASKVCDIDLRIDLDNSRSNLPYKRNYSVNPVGEGPRVAKAKSDASLSASWPTTGSVWL